MTDMHLSQNTGFMKSLHRPYAGRPQIIIQSQFIVAKLE